MGNQENPIRNANIVFNYQSDGTKYYLLTGGTGYPLAEFSAHLTQEGVNNETVLVHRK
ncbi:MAG: hypothetical protein RQM92_07065 [Candidatus Syntrophopropionicum ammoniitolerans]